MINKIKKELRKKQDKENARNLGRFFKTGKGEYGEGDVFLGIKVPEQRKTAKEFFKEASFKDLKELLWSEIHEFRLTALIILVEKYKRADTSGKERIFNFYIGNTKRINNWDLVDLSAPNIVGDYLLDKDRKIIFSLAKSKNIWERRIAVLATFAFIREKQFEESLKLAEILLNDEHDLIHKAVGWMLREVGKRDKETERAFLKKFCLEMPRTMLRYAIEKFEPGERKKFLKS
ncbi:MAG: DNA alkylation repair protein [Candidatus Pacebacteria bacterium]|nr:DNA alkylation repair protein [Candidatus Paceibacterota bacterium]